MHATVCREVYGKTTMSINRNREKQTCLTDQVYNDTSRNNGNTQKHGNKEWAYTKITDGQQTEKTQHRQNRTDAKNETYRTRNNTEHRKRRVTTINVETGKKGKRSK